MNATANSSPLETVRRYYALIDAGEGESPFQFFAEEAVVRFGDQPDIHGREAVAAVVRDMVAIAKSVTHEIVRPYEVAGDSGITTVICEAKVTYVMALSENTISHNAVTISEVDSAGFIVAQRNVGDLGPVIADHHQHAGE